MEELGLPCLESHDMPFVRSISTSGSLFPTRPVIGYTPEQRVRRFVWSRLHRVGRAVHRRLARFDRHEGDGYEVPEEYWLRRSWSWLDAVAKRSLAAKAQPIYDPDWTPPAKVTMH